MWAQDLIYVELSEYDDCESDDDFCKNVVDGVALKMDVQFKDLNLNANLCKSVDIRFN